MTTVHRAVAALILLGGLAVTPIGAEAQGQPAALDQVQALLRQGVPPQAIMERLRTDCIAFEITEENVRLLREAGADDAFIRAIRGVCKRLPTPEPVTPPPDEDTRTTVSPGSAAVRSLLIPGLGQFATRKPALGVAFLLAWGGALGYGLLSEEVTVECLARVETSCPAGDVRNESVKRPALAIGVGAAVAVAVVSALHARSAAGQMAVASTRRTGRPFLVEPVLPNRSNTGVGLQLRIRF